MSSIRSSTDAQCVCHIRMCTLEKMSILDIFRNFYNIFSCCVSRSESELVPMMMDSLLTLPPGTHVAVQATVLDLLAELAPWINKHSEFLGTASMCVCVCVCVCVCLCHYLSATPLPSPPLPPPDRVLAFILVGLRSRDLSTHAAFAIQAICSACQESMKQHFEGLLQVRTYLCVFVCAHHSLTYIQYVHLCRRSNTHYILEQILMFLLLWKFILKPTTQERVTDLQPPPASLTYSHLLPP